MNCLRCPNRRWEKTPEDAERQMAICKNCEKCRGQGLSCMGGHRKMLSSVVLNKEGIIKETKNLHSG
jgi:hypothetical protein